MSASVDQMGSLRRAAGPCLLVGMLLVIAACDDAFIDPFDNDDRYFTIYGFLDVIETEHVVRVIPVRKSPERITAPDDAQAILDATVTSTDLNAGRTHVWRHTLEQLDDGAYAHIFRADFIVVPGHTYRLEVRRPDGITASAETTVPDFIDLPPLVLDPVAGTPDSGLTQGVYLPQLPSPWAIRVNYYIGEGLATTRIPISYGRPGRRTDDGGWQFTINLSEDAAAIRAASDFNDPDSELDGETPPLVRMGLSVRVLDTNWDLPEDFDPEVLAQPGTLSNVENGYGFWGSIGVYVKDWPVSDALRGLLDAE